MFLAGPWLIKYDLDATNDTSQCNANTKRIIYYELPAALVFIIPLRNSAIYGSIDQLCWWTNDSYSIVITSINGYNAKFLA
jgi:hypothetical protein